MVSANLKETAPIKETARMSILDGLRRLDLTRFLPLFRQVWVFRAAAWRLAYYQRPPRSSQNRRRLHQPSLQSSPISRHFWNCTCSHV